MYFFYFFAVVLIFLGYKSLVGGINYWQYFNRELIKPPSGFNPFVSVFVPCRGHDQNLRTNLSAVLNQNYPNFEVVFIVDDITDASVSIIKKLMDEASLLNDGKESRTLSNASIKLVVSGKAKDEGQKVHNLRHAVAEASRKSVVFAFVDSDTRPNPNWLRDLVEPLVDQKIGCTTGYRWFISETQNFPSQLRSVWNASIASALGANMKSNFCWGGSMAIRREIFEKINMREQWRGTLSDDFAMTKALIAADMPIYFVPNCLTATIEDCNFRELLEFTTRQMKITRVYASNLWVASLIGSGVFTITFWSGFVLLFFLSGVHFWLTFTALIVIVVLGAAKSWVRLKAVKMVLKVYEKELTKSIFWQLTLWNISAALYFYNCLCALISNVIYWRGIRYRLESPKKTKILDSIS